MGCMNMRLFSFWRVLYFKYRHSNLLSLEVLSRGLLYSRDLSRRALSNYFNAQKASRSSSSDIE